MKKIPVLNHRLGMRNVQLYADPRNNDASAHLMPDGGKVTEMVVGIRSAWHYTVESLLHESFEVAIQDVGGQFKPTPDFAQSTGNFFFFFSHLQYQEAVARAAEFVAAAMPHLERVWKANRSKKRKEENAKKIRHRHGRQRNR